MKSSSPFNWQSQPSTLFSKQEKATLHNNIVVRDLKPKVLAFYQKAKPKGSK
jgi:hypothetical protein